MKRFILPLLLLLAVGLLIAAESEPSEVVGYVKYDCVAGLNLVALPIEQGFTLSSEVGDTYPGQIDQISRWDADLQFWESAVFYDFGDGTGIWDPDFNVSIGTPVMASVTSPTTWPQGPRGNNQGTLQKFTGK